MNRITVIDDLVRKSSRTQEEKLARNVEGSKAKRGSMWVKCGQRHRFLQNVLRVLDAGNQRKEDWWNEKKGRCPSTARSHPSGQSNLED
ncbi:MAG: hypothetical protein HXS52_05545 [Theionarchaea archaeon]|nr:hypothetical protein [Theionarchaea archaeon]